MDSESTISSRNKDFISRKKYNKAKNAAKAWYSKYEHQKEHNEMLEGELNKLQDEVKRWKNYSEELPDNEIVNELEHVNSSQKSVIKSLKKQQRKYDEKINQMERDHILLQGKVEQLQEAKKDLRERYNELKEDYRSILKRKIT